VRVHLQVLGITDDMEFLTQSVSERRVHDIIREAMARSEKPGG